MAIKLDKIVISLVRLLGWLSMVSVVALMVMMTIDVILRYGFNRPILWSYDASEYLMVCFTYFAIAYAELREDHVNIDLIYVRLRERTRIILNLINRLIMLALSVFIVQQAWLRTVDSFQVGRTSTGPVSLPQGPVEGVVCFGSLILCLLLIVKIVGYGRQLFNLKQ
ncbi:MAG: TRAP transporter small permease [Deltaproteobacteria bacterium]|nr:TRAP transporter small permease [Deltaproteobacteria bacterium]